MAEYYLAPALVRLRDEINFTHRNRDKTSDGWIGDASHAARASDHNPDYSADGVVRATDTDKDGIFPEDLLFDAIHDDRVEYVIWNGYIYMRSNGFRKQVYTGANKHTGHVHISLRHGKQFEDDARNWGYADRVLGRLSPAPTVGKSELEIIGMYFDDLAREVIAGKWGNGPERSRRLQAAGISPTIVQERVNRMLGVDKPAAVRLSVEVLADQAIQGQWGNGLERRRRLAAAGYDPDAVQAVVNRKLR